MSGMSYDTGGNQTPLQKKFRRMSTYFHLTLYEDLNHKINKLDYCFLMCRLNKFDDRLNRKKYITPT